MADMSPGSDEAAAVRMLTARARLASATRSQPSMSGLGHTLKSGRKVGNILMLPLKSTAQR